MKQKPEEKKPKFKLFEKKNNKKGPGPSEEFKKKFKLSK